MAGNPLFGIDIAGTLGAALRNQLLKATLTQFADGTRTSGQVTGGKNPTPTVYSDIDAFLEEYGESQIDGELVKDGDRKVILIGDSLPDGVVPAVGDRIAIESFTDLQVQRVRRDPAAATYTCQVRG